jgi:hypothetical protein
LLDKIVFQKTGFFFRSGEDVFDIFGFSQETVYFAVIGGDEIGLDPVSQRTRLADVNDVMGPVFKKVYSGIFRECIQFGLQGFYDFIRQVPVLSFLIF